MKKFWMIIGAIAAVGLIICSIGFFTGAKLSMYFDGKGWHLADGKPKFIQETYDTITELDINSGNGNVEIKTGDKYSVDITYYSGEPTVECENGVLTVKSYDFFMNFGFHFYTNKIIITLPENAELSKAKIDNNNGKTVVEKLNAKEASIENDNGYMELRNITSEKLSIVSRNGATKTYDITAESIDVKNHNGEVVFENIASETGKFELFNGAIKGSYITGNHSFKVHNGGVRIGLKNLNDYYITANTANGSTRIGGQKVNAYGNTDAKNKLELKTFNGNVRVTEE